MKRTASGIGLIFLAGSLYAQFPGPNPGSVRKPRPRVIATTDGEIDDRCSMVRFLLYAIEFQIEGGGPGPNGQARGGAAGNGRGPATPSGPPVARRVK